MKKGLVLINAYSNLPAHLNQGAEMKKELEELGVQIDVKRNKEFFAYINSQGMIETKLKDYDFCVYIDKDKYMSKLLEMAGIRIFNSHQAISDCDDKMVTYLKLANKNILMPKTLSGPLCYTPDQNVRSEMIDIIEKELGYPLIVKGCYGARGQNVFKADDREMLIKIANNVKGTPHLFQEFVKTSRGKDIRAIVIGHKFITAIERRADEDFRANLALGGEGILIKLPKKVEDLCVKISKILKLDYCGIDLLYGEKGKVLVCEVNSNAFFGVSKISGINIAKKYAEHIYKEIYG